ncbi:MAG: ImmA/IrrE family metallo-endopeptidase [Solirubrobacterales bacterium]|nr:ImmA/IrrE family metallo-endopeptidase [Solirubrobacterales bacterium]
MEAIEERAGELLARVPDWIWDGESLPVPVEDIADSCCGLLVRDVEEMSAAPGCPPLGDGQSLSGLLLPSVGEIWVNADEARQWPRRRRFTIGHELGHWILHQREQTALFCRHGQVEADPAAEAAPAAERPALDPIEEEANHFAAALLMPAALIRREYERTGGAFEHLCQMFNSSGAAMGRRLHQVI